MNEQRQKQSQSASGYGGTSYGGNGAGNSTSVNFEGSTYKEASQSVYVPPVAGRPYKDCRLYISFGGSSRDGTAAGGIPIGNSQICVSDVQWDLMERINKKRPDTFSVDDFISVACKVEGMDQYKACKP